MLPTEDQEDDEPAKCEVPNPPNVGPPTDIDPAISPGTVPHGVSALDPCGVPYDVYEGGGEGPMDVDGTQPHN